MEKKDFPELVFCIGILLLMMCLVIFFLLTNGNYPSEAQRMPRLAAIGALVFGSLILVHELPLLFKSTRSKLFFGKIYNNRGLLMVLLMVVYTILLKTFGFLITTIGFMAVTTYLLGMKNKLGVVVFSASSTLVVYYLFHHVFAVHLPQGIFF